MKWPKRRKGEGWYCSRGIACFHSSLLSALWHDWKGWDEGAATAPWERLLLFRVRRYYVAFRQMGVRRWEAVRASWWMPRIDEAQTRLDELLREYPETHPKVIAARKVVEHLKRLKPFIATK